MTYKNNEIFWHRVTNLYKMYEAATDADFKISNDYIAFYSRLFMKWNPRHKGFFKTKPMKGESYAISK